MGIVASLDKELFALLLDEQASMQLRDLLVDTYLSAPATHIPKVLPFFIGMVAMRLFALVDFIFRLYQTQKVDTENMQ